MTIQEIEERRAEIAVEIETEGADLDALETEVRSLAEQEKEIREKAEADAEKRAAIAQGLAPQKIEVIEEVKQEERKEMTNMEIRDTKEYIDAYARYIKSGNDQECRAILTENVDGGMLPVPSFVDEVVKTAWEKDEILSRVTKTYFKGNLKVAFELSADGAYIHTEGTTAVTEEDLQLGIVTMLPAMIKKFVKISDETVAMGGESFLRYIYDELTYRITKAIADQIVYLIGSGGAADSSHVGVGYLDIAPALDTVAQLYALLSDEATNPVIIMNRATYADFAAAQAAANYAFDPFMGLPVLFNNSLPSYTTAEEADAYLIVGDLSGAQVNYPEGDDVVIKYDDLTLAEADMVKIVGRQYAAIALTKNNAFAYAGKPSAATTE